MNRKNSNTPYLWQSYWQNGDWEYLLELLNNFDPNINKISEFKNARFNLDVPGLERDRRNFQYKVNFATWFLWSAIKALSVLNKNKNDNYWLPGLDKDSVNLVNVGLIFEKLKDHGFDLLDVKMPLKFKYSEYKSLFLLIPGTVINGGDPEVDEDKMKYKFLTDFLSTQNIKEEMIMIFIAVNSNCSFAEKLTRDVNNFDYSKLLYTIDLENYIDNFASYDRCLYNVLSNCIKNPKTDILKLNDDILSHLESDRIKFLDSSVISKQKARVKNSLSMLKNYVDVEREKLVLDKETLGSVSVKSIRL